MGAARNQRLGDDQLAAEIELYGDLVVAASESETDLTQPQIDRVLGVDGGAGEDGDADDLPNDGRPAADTADGQPNRPET